VTERYMMGGKVWLDGKEQATITILESDFAAVEKERDEYKSAADKNYQMYLIADEYKSKAEALLREVREYVASSSSHAKYALLTRIEEALK
jgi:hypothetical protein